MASLLKRQNLFYFLLWPFIKAYSKPKAIALNILQQPNKAFPVVDFLKGLSVLMVILFHIFFAVFFLFKKQPEQLQAFIDSIPVALNFVLAFDKAVDIFFMLSSFLLTFALLKVFSKKQKIDIGRFYLHRFFRIYPLFVVALLLYGLADIEKLLRDGWYSLLFIENIYSKGIIPVQWSLSIEMQFYLVLPFLVLFLARSYHPIKWLMLFIVISICARFLLALSDADIYQTHWYQMMDTAQGKIYMDTMYYVIQSRITPLLLGMLWALILWRYPQQTLQSSLPLKLAVWLPGLVIIYLTLSFPVYAQSSFYYESFNEQVNLLLVTLHRILFSIAILVLVLFSYYQLQQSPQTFWQKTKTTFINCRAWRLLSEVAYPMYFFHFPFIILAWAITLGTTDVASINVIPLYLIPITFVLAVLFTLYFSLWLNFLVEARFIQIGKQIETKWFGGHNAHANKDLS